MLAPARAFSRLEDATQRGTRSVSSRLAPGLDTVPCDVKCDARIMAEVARSDENNGLFLSGSSTIDVGLERGPMLRHPAATDGSMIASSRATQQDVSDGATIIADASTIGGGESLG